MVIGYLRIVENFFGFRNFCSQQGFGEQIIIFDSFQDVRDFRIHIVAQVSGVDTRISCYFFLVKTLDEFERFVG